MFYITFLETSSTHGCLQGYYLGFMLILFILSPIPSPLLILIWFHCSWIIRRIHINKTHTQSLGFVSVAGLPYSLPFFRLLFALEFCSGGCGVVGEEEHKLPPSFQEQSSLWHIVNVSVAWCQSSRCLDSHRSPFPNSRTKLWLLLSLMKASVHEPRISSGVKGKSPLSPILNSSQGHPEWFFRGLQWRFVDQ